MQPSKLLALDAIDLYPLGGNQHLIVNRHTLKRGILSNHLLPLLNLCDYFRTLEEHCELMAGNLANPEESGTALMSLLKDLQQTGILVSADQWLQRIEYNQKNTSPDPNWVLAITTCDRPALLQRLLDSALPHITTVTPPARLLLLDDSRQTSHRTENQSIWRDWLERCGLLGEYWDRTARINLCHELGQKFSDYDAQSIDWLLSPQTVDERISTPGQNRNLALLLSAGRRLLILDDDCILTAQEHRQRTPSLHVGTLLIQTVPFRDRSALTDTMQPLDINPLASHLHYLGMSFGQLCKWAMQNSEGLDWLRTLDPATRKRLEASSAAVSVTLNATSGDPGTGDMGWLYTRASHCNSEIARYLQDIEDNARNERLFWRGRHQPLLTYDENLMTTTLTGLDNRILLPCVIPFGRGEDRMLGSGLQALHESSLFFCHNWSLPHEPEPVRYWQRPSVATQVFIPPPEHLIISSIERKIDPGLQHPSARLAYIANLYRELSASSDQRLTAELNRHYLQMMTKSLQAYTSNQAILENDATHMHRDLALLIENTTQEIAEPLQFDAEWLTRFRQLADHYGRALSLWDQLREDFISINKKPLN